MKEDFNLSEGKGSINRDADLIFQQIDILFDSTYGDLQGDVGFGTDYESMLYDLHLTNDALRLVVMKDICAIDLRGYTPTVEVYMLRGTEQDIALIDITLSKYNNSYKKTYKIE